MILSLGRFESMELSPPIEKRKRKKEKENGALGTTAELSYGT